MRAYDDGKILPILPILPIADNTNISIKYEITNRK
jgi:hypothetical protein